LNWVPPARTPFGAFFHAADKGFQAAFGPFVKADVLAPNDVGHSSESPVSELLNIRECLAALVLTHFEHGRLT
jgi:hypothetical protein